MSKAALDLLCIGNAIVDILAPVSSETLSSIGSTPGSMKLVDAEEAAHIESMITPKEVMGGGSAANTAVVAHRIGARVGYLGKVAADPAGQQYIAELQGQGVSFPSAPIEDAAMPTARCIVLVTPDGQRTMHTYLGISTLFNRDDLDEAFITSASILYMEGYLFDKSEAQSAFREAACMAHKAGRKVALTLSDSFCVDRHRAAFLELIRHHIDIVFANEAEICALYQTQDFDEATRQIADDAMLAVITRSEQGAVIIEGKNVTTIPTHPVKLVDSTGAGDAFAGGFLAFYTRGRDLVACAQAGHAAAASVIARMGARPDAAFALA